MKKKTSIQLTIDTPAIGKVITNVPYTKNEEGNQFSLDIPNSHFCGTNFTTIDFSHVVEYDVKHFKKLNEISDENHQVYIDTLCIYGVQILGNFIRIQYTFHQDGNEEIHRMCAGVLTDASGKMEWNGQNKFKKLFPEGYSPDVCVYW